MASFESIELIGGPLDGAIVDGKSRNPDAEVKKAGKLEFGGLIYQVNMEKGTATYVSGTVAPDLEEVLRQGGHYEGEV